MLSDEAVMWIKATVDGVYRGNPDKTLDALNIFLELAESGKNIELSINDIASSTDMEKQARIRELTNIDSFAKNLINLVNPDVIKRKPTLLKHDGSAFPKWTLEPLLKEALSVVPKDLDLNTKPEKCKENKRYLEQYLRVYQFRNQDDHGEKPQLSMMEMQNIITSYIVVCLNMINHYSKDLKRIRYEKQIRSEFDLDTYSQKICKDYWDMEKNGFGYVDIHWINLMTYPVSTTMHSTNLDSKLNPKADNYPPSNIYTEEYDDEAEIDSSELDYVVDDLAFEKDIKYIKFLGMAGVGKSTSLKRIEYILANRQKDTLNSVIPIYIELVLIKDMEDIFVNQIAHRLSIPRDLVFNLLNRGMVCLLLDGYNEILDPAFKKSVSNELDTFRKKYPQIRIFLTDRNVSEKTGVPVLHDAEKLYLCQIDMKIRKTFFEKNCHDKECLSILLQKMEETPECFKDFDTPLKLRQLINLVSDNKAFPKDFVAEYLDFLMNREREEKKDENIDYLPTLLQSVALLFENDEIETANKLKIQNQMAHCINTFGYNKADTNQCLKLALDMGILIEEELDIIRFTSYDYQQYFFYEALNRDMEKYL